MVKIILLLSIGVVTVVTNRPIAGDKMRVVKDYKIPFRPM